MSALSILALLATVLITTTISGVFGMAGGVIFMGVLAVLLPISAAMVTHGIIQIAANGSRATLHRRQIVWPIIGWYLLGTALALAVVTLLAYAPSPAMVNFGLAGVCFIVWLPGKLFALDAQNPPHAALCGLSVTGLNIAAGVAGPLLDIFFIKTTLTRHQIVATKAVTQVLSHAAKIAFYGLALLIAAQASTLPPWWVLALGIALSFVGTAFGAKWLNQMTDKGFLAWTKWLITAMGFLYLARALHLIGIP